MTTTSRNERGATVTSWHRAAQFSAAVLMLIAGCTGAAEVQLSEPSLSTDSRLVGTDTAEELGRPPVAADATLGSTAVLLPVTAVPSRSADAAGPHGAADLWIGAGRAPSGLQRSLGPGDLPGPLWNVPSGGRGLFRVFDMCGRTEVSFLRGGDFDQLVSEFGNVPASRMHRGCTGQRFLAVAHGPWFEHERRYFRFRRNAETWVTARYGQYARASERLLLGSVQLMSDATALGFVESISWGRGEPYGLAFAAWDAPIDEVRVLPGSVLVRDGVLRGMVRNWSRQRWAYEVIVSAAGESFVWPLSLQPGEVAPFEIAGWNGPEDPEQIEFDVAADMSPHADPSRSFDLRGSDGGLFVGESVRRALPPGVRARYGRVSADIPPSQVSSGSLRKGSVHLTIPSSHPSLADDVEGLRVQDIRGYGALFDRDGRVVDVGAAVIGHSYWAPTGAGDNALQWDEVRHLQRDDGAVGDLELRFDVHATWPDRYSGEHPRGEFPSDLRVVTERGDWYWEPIEGGFAFWIGAAHPSRPVS